MDSRDNAHSSVIARHCASSGVAIHTKIIRTALESTFSHNAANIMDRHAAYAARDDRKNAASKKVDSRFAGLESTLEKTNA